MNAIAEQRSDALQVANEYRLALADRRKEIAAMPYSDGRSALADLIEMTDCPKMLAGRVFYWLTAPHRAGTTKAFRVLAALEIRDANRRLRDLTDRQRSLLADAVRNNYRVER